MTAVAGRGAKSSSRIAARVAGARCWVALLGHVEKKYPTFYSHFCNDLAMPLAVETYRLPGAVLGTEISGFASLPADNYIDGR